MLKFDLARKYLVGLLTVAMVFSLFVMPINAAPSPTVNASEWSVTVTPTSGLNPTTGTDSTHTITIETKVNGTLADPATGTVYVAVAFGNPLVVTSSGWVASQSSTGVYTYTFIYGTAPIDLGPGTYTIYGYISANGSGIDPADVISSAVTKTWADRVITTITPTQGTTLTDTNNVTDGQTTHTITVEVKDQFKALVSSGTLNYNITGSNTKSGTIAINSGTATLGYTNTDTTAESSGVLGHDIIVLSGGTASATFYKTWTYTPLPSGVTVNNDGSETPTAYNYVDETQTITVTVKDQYGFPYTGTLTLSFTATKVSGDATVTPTSGTITTNTGVFVLNFTNANGKAGKTQVTLTPSGFALQTATFYKVWGYRPHATPEMETNLIGEIHTITLYGFPGDPIPTLSQITGYPDPSNVITITKPSGDFPDTGMAEFRFKCKLPGTYFFDFQGVTHYINGTWSETTTTYALEVKKHWAEMTFPITVTPTLKINALTLTDADTHEVSATVLGEYPLWPGVTVPPVPPPLGGHYVVVADVIWVVDAPISGVPVTFEVTTSNPAFTLTPSKDTAKTDSNGVATFSYRLSYNSGTSTFHVCEITDSIKVTAKYGDPLIAAEKGSFSQTVEKKWRDHAFKVIKYDKTNPDTLLPGAKLFLRYVSDPLKTITTTTPTFVPTYASVYPSAPPVPGVVTTDTNGAAIWYHLPYGKYALYEYAPPTGYDLISGKIMEFVVSEDSPYWCGPDPKMEIYSLANTPTTPTIPVTPTDTVQFNKITYCYQYLIGAKFQAENLTTHLTYDATSIAPNGLVKWTNLPATNSPSDKDTWYKVTEISVPSTDVKLVDPFFFRLDTSGNWDDTFYAAPSTTATKVWPLATYEALPPAHYVINPKSVDGAYPAYFTILPASSSLVLPGNTTQNLTVKVLDQTLAPMVGKTVNLSTDFGTLSAPSVVTGADGTAPFSISTTIKGAGTANITGTIVLPSQTYKAYATVNWTLSTPVITTVTLQPSSVTLTLPGQKSQSFLVTVLDQYGDGMGGQVVNIWSDFGLLSNTNLYTNSLGQATFNITSSDPGVAHISATADSKFATATVTWVLPTPPPEPTLYQLSLAAGWNLVTPGVSSSKTAAELFGPNLQGVFHYDPTMPGPEGSGGYLVCTNQTLVPGWGYWVKMSAAYVADMTGTAVASPKTMALNKGWEQIGNPFEVDIAVSKVSITKNFVTKSLADALAAGWISPLFSYDGSAYQILDLTSGVLHKGQGFWVKVLVDGCSITYTR